MGQSVTSVDGAGASAGMLEPDVRKVTYAHTKPVGSGEVHDGSLHQDAQYTTSWQRRTVRDFSSLYRAKYAL